jgi:16S rRNA (cytosine1402-N4)-methyltransferase
MPLYNSLSCRSRLIWGKEMAEQHVPVLKNEVLRYLEPDRARIVVDATVGAGGHAEAILSEHHSLTLIGLDRDPTALELAARRLSCFGDRFRPVHDAFSNIASALSGLGPVDAILADLGVSSMQLDDPGRGFSYRTDAPLDMRMGTSGETAAGLIARLDVAAIADLLGRYGEIRRPRKLARAIKSASDADGVASTAALAAIVRSTFGDAPPSLLSRVFQAFRVAVNGELDELERFLPDALECLGDGGRLVVISYHSLEDRTVKHFLRDMSARCICPPELPVCVCGRSPRLEVLTRRVVRPGDEEIAANSRARSARLRAARRLGTEVAH